MFEDETGVAASPPSVGKTCTKCGECKLPSEFSKDGRVSSGLRSQCRTCRSADHKAWSMANLEKKKATEKAWQDANKERQREYKIVYRSANAMHIKEKRKEKSALTLLYNASWRAANPDKQREMRRRAYLRKKSDTKYKLNVAISGGIRDSVKKGAKAGRRWEALTGYTVDELMTHLENLFLPGMSWDNHGKYGWHIDHRIPLAAHNFETPDDIDFKRAWALSNLQPMWAVDNMKKGAKLDSPFQPSLAIAA